MCSNYWAFVYLIPFSVAEILIILLVILLLFNIIRVSFETIKYKSTYYIKKILLDILVALQ